MITKETRHPIQRRELSSERFGLALFAAASIAGVLACSSDDGDDSEADPQSEALGLEAIEPVQVPPRAFPAPPGPGDDTLNGLSLPEQMPDWGVIGVVNVPTGNTPTVRVIVGNPAAVAAARSGQTNPWPDGAMLGHIQWASGASPSPGSGAIVPTDFAALTLMVKNAERFEDDGGWAFGVWGGPDLVPLADPQFDRACVTCHSSNVPPEKDGVFSIIAELPPEAAIAAAEPALNDVELPPDILDWRVIGIASREADTNPNIRVIVGNDIAVDAARSGETNPWPDGSMLAHYVWAAGENPIAPDTVNPVAFSAFTLMMKDSVEFAADGGWAYGNWNWANVDLAPSDDPEFDRACVDCHTSNVADNDYVFTIPGELPAALIAP